MGKLTEEDVALIRELLEEGRARQRHADALNQRAIAEKFGVKKDAINRLSTGKTWNKQQIP